MPQRTSRLITFRKKSRRWIRKMKRRSKSYVPVTAYSRKIKRNTRRAQKALRILLVSRPEQPSLYFRRKPTMLLFNLLLTQLLVYNRSIPAAATKLRRLFCYFKKQNKIPIQYLTLFMKKAMPRLFLRDYRAGNRRLLVPVPASYSKRRLFFVKQFLKDTNIYSANTNFTESIFNEIEEFNAKRGQTYTRKLDTYIISKQNRNYSKYGYRAKAYINKNVTKKSKLKLL